MYSVLLFTLLLSGWDAALADAFASTGADALTVRATSPTSFQAPAVAAVVIQQWAMVFHPELPLGQRWPWTEFPEWADFGNHAPFRPDLLFYSVPQQDQWLYEACNLFSIERSVFVSEGVDDAAWPGGGYWRTTGGDVGYATMAGPLPWMGGVPYPLYGEVAEVRPVAFRAGGTLVVGDPAPAAVAEPSTLLLAATAVAVLFAVFDWRDLGCVTPVRNQMIWHNGYQYDTSTCYAHAAVASLESQLLISTGRTPDSIDLSEQLVDYVGLQSAPNYPANAFQYLADVGTVDDSLVPLVLPWESVLPPWMRAGNPRPYTLYTANHANLSIGTDPAVLKPWIREHGPVGVEIIQEQYFNLWTPSTDTWETLVPLPQYGEFGNHPIFDPQHTPYPFPLEDGRLAYLADTLAYHVVAITGYHDDPEWLGGGYWEIKNSYPDIWPINWPVEPDGYGHISYAQLETVLPGPTPRGMFQPRLVMGAYGGAYALTYTDAGLVLGEGVMEVGVEGWGPEPLTIGSPGPVAVPESGQSASLVALLALAAILSTRRV